MSRILLFSLIVPLSLASPACCESPALEPAGHVDEDAPPAPSTAWPVGGACLHSLHPAAILAALDAFSQQTGGKPDLWWDLQKNVKRRFDLETHLPFQKGFVVFFGSEGFFRLDFELVVDDLGAEQVMAEFSRQWIASTPMAHPNYEVATHSVGEGLWVVDVQALFWRPVFPPGFDQKVTYEKSSHPHYKTYFRRHGKYLWSSNRLEVLNGAELHEIPEQLLDPSDAHQGRVATVWFDPNGIPEHLRKAWFDEIRQQIAPALQPQDDEYDAATVLRQTRLLAKNEAIRSAMFDLDSAFVFLDIQDGRVSLHGLAQLKPDSTASRWMRLFAPQIPVHSMKTSLSSSCDFQISGRIPAVKLSQQGTELLPADEGGSFDMVGVVSLDASAASSGQIGISVSDSLAEGLGAFAQRTLIRLNVLLQGLNVFKTDGAAEPTLARVIPDPTGSPALQVAWGSSVTEESTARTEETKLNYARLRIHMEFAFLKSLRVFLERAGRAQESGGTARPGVDSVATSETDHFEGLDLRLQLKPHQIEFTSSASVAATYELLATLLRLGFRL